MWGTGRVAPGVTIRGPHRTARTVFPYTALPPLSVQDITRAARKCCKFSAVHISVGCSTRLALQPSFQCRRGDISRSRVLLKRHPFFAVETQRQSGPFAPRELPRINAPMNRSDFRCRRAARLWFPWCPCPDSTAESRLRSGSPGYRVLSFVTRPLQPPRAARRVHLSVSSPPIPGFAIFGRLANRQWRNEAESSSLVLGLATSLSDGYHPPSPFAIAKDRSVSRALLPPHATAQLHVERTIYMCSTSQLHRKHRQRRRAESRESARIFSSR